MKNLAFAILGLLLCHTLHSQSNYAELELVGITQLSSSERTRFDLSGIVNLDEKTLVIADKDWNNSIYEIKFNADKWSIKNEIPLNISEPLDLEGIDVCMNAYYLVNEVTGNVHIKKQGQETKVLDIDFGSMFPGEWGNAGWEGLAIDCEKQIGYLTKERQPRAVFVVDLKKLMIDKTFDIPLEDSNDFADTKFENGFLYLLERNGNYITKVDPATEEVLAKVSYRKTCSAESGKLFEPTNFGMAEALTLTEDEIWLGLDNNGLEASQYAKGKYGIEGRSPVILKFKRPENF
ncbi:MAG: SdiA-regulated domain-containing protein [Cyclobacteriaceae bacterium]